MNVADNADQSFGAFGCVLGVVKGVAPLDSIM